jgi:general secretion pathway protein A
MYESFFGLREPAFSLSPDPRFLWASETHQEGLSLLQYGISQRKGFLLLTGEIGTGKTTLLHAALERLPAGTETAIITNTASLGRLDVLKLVAREFGIRDMNLESKADYVVAVTDYLFKRLAAGLNTVLIVDEAQNLDGDGLEEVRLLSNIESPSQKSLQIVLIGQPELRTTLASPRMRPLRQRIAWAHHIDAIAAHEVRAYLGHRIEVAGGRFEEVFAPGVEPIFAAFSSGCPRLLNILADRALLAAFAKQVRPVPPELVERKADESAGLNAAEFLLSDAPAIPAARAMDGPGRIPEEVALDFDDEPSELAVLARLDK